MYSSSRARARRTARRGRRTPRPASRRRRRASTGRRTGGRAWPSPWRSRRRCAGAARARRWPGGCARCAPPPRQPDQRIGEIERLGPTGHLPARVVRVLRLVAGRHDDVLDGPQRLEAAGLGAWARATAPSGDDPKPVLANITPNFMGSWPGADRAADSYGSPLGPTNSVCMNVGSPASSIDSSRGSSSVKSALSSMRASIAPRQ